jgi:HPt (histidine-containing phosphotransfer) domain-containing protein
LFRVALQLERVGPFLVRRMSPPARIDWNTALRNVGDDRDTLRDALDLLLDLAPGFIADIRASFDAHDVAGVKQAVHRLRGPALLLGAGETTQIAEDIELRASAGELADAEEIERLALALADLCVETQRAAHRLRASDVEPMASLFDALQEPTVALDARDADASRTAGS